MTYQPKPGSLSLFKNDRRENDRQPEYRGDGLLPDGTPVWVSGWVKEGSRGKFFSLSIQPKEQRQERGSPGGGRFGDDRGSQGGRAQSRGSFGGDPDADIPFAACDGAW